MSDKTAAVVALATYIVGGGVAIGWRLWWQWRRTGSTGFKGVSGNIGSAEWWGGLVFILLKVHGGSYREYASTVGRFVPRTGLIH